MSPSGISDLHEGATKRGGRGQRDSCHSVSIFRAVPETTTTSDGGGAASTARARAYTIETNEPEPHSKAQPPKLRPRRQLPDKPMSKGFH